MTDCNQKFADASAEVDKYLREAGIEPPEEEDGDKSRAYNSSARKMLFTGTYSNEALSMLDGACCPNPFNNPNCTGESDLTLDHITPVSEYFNKAGWRYDRETRDEWYTNPQNLQVLCRSCNSMKGGKPFDIDKVARCLREGRG